MFGLGTTELILILVIVVIFFGAGKLPEVGAGIAKGIRNFKHNLKDEPAKDNDAQHIIDAEGANVTKVEAKKKDEPVAHG